MKKNERYNGEVSDMESEQQQWAVVGERKMSRKIKYRKNKEQ